MTDKPTAWMLRAARAARTRSARQYGEYRVLCGQVFMSEETAARAAERETNSWRKVEGFPVYAHPLAADEPVAWMVRKLNGDLAGIVTQDGKRLADDERLKGWTETPLYAHPPAAEPTGEVAAMRNSSDQLAGETHESMKRRTALIERLSTFADLLSSEPLEGLKGDVAYDLIRKAAAKIASDGQRLSATSGEVIQTDWRDDMLGYAYQLIGSLISASDGPAAMKVLDAFAEPSQQAMDALSLVAGLQLSSFVPGVLRCAKCEFRLVKTTLNVADGNAYANNEPDRCPNCHVPMWRVSWKQEAKEAYSVVENQIERAVTAEREVARLREALKQAVEHLEHQAAWIGRVNLGERAGTYSFEALGEDMPGIKAALEPSV